MSPGSASPRWPLSDCSPTWERPAITTHGRNNHAIRDDRWRYIRYADGSEELYDHQSDPHEWTNLAGNPQYAKIKDRLARWLPNENVPDAPKRKSQRGGMKKRKRRGSGKEATTG